MIIRAVLVLVVNSGKYFGLYLSSMMISKVKIAEARPMSAPARGISPWSNKLMFRTCPIVRVMTNMEAMLLKTTAAVDVP